MTIPKPCYYVFTQHEIMYDVRIKWIKQFDRVISMHEKYVIFSNGHLDNIHWNTLGFKHKNMLWLLETSQDETSY